MSGIYISGMEMPQNCFVCQFRIGRFCPFIDGWKNNVEKYEADNRHPFCPLVPVPPHGDLVDKDATMNAILEERGEDTACWFAGVVNDMPAIVPSDKAEEGE